MSYKNSQMLDFLIQKKGVSPLPDVIRFFKIISAKFMNRVSTFHAHFSFLSLFFYRFPTSSPKKPYVLLAASVYVS